jgi:hypothetical protein
MMGSETIFYYTDELMQQADKILYARCLLMISDDFPQVSRLLYTGFSQTWWVSKQPFVCSQNSKNLSTCDFCSVLPKREGQIP